MQQVLYIFVKRLGPFSQKWIILNFGLCFFKNMSALTKVIKYLIQCIITKIRCKSFRNRTIKIMNIAELGQNHKH